MKKEESKRIEEIRQKRIAVLLGAYEFMRQRYLEIREFTYLNKSLVAVTIEDYLRDRQAIKNRHNIEGKIQRHKVAGLVAAAIVKNRPIQLLEEDSPTARISMDNEVLAVLHGLAICAEGHSAEKIRTLLSLDFFRGWFDDFIYLLRRHPSNTEAFIAIFHTLSITYFAENLIHTQKKKPSRSGK